MIYLQFVLAALAPSVADLQRRKRAGGHQDRRNLVKSAGPARFCGDPPAVIVLGIKVIGRSNVDPGQDGAVEQRREAREDEQEVEDHGGSAHDGGDLLVRLGDDTGDKNKRADVQKQAVDEGQTAPAPVGGLDFTGNPDIIGKWAQKAVSPLTGGHALDLDQERAELAGIEGVPQQDGDEVHGGTEDLEASQHRKRSLEAGTAKAVSDAEHGALGFWLHGKSSLEVGIFPQLFFRIENRNLKIEN
jgi:hypothetical protein